MPSFFSPAFVAIYVLISNSSFIIIHSPSMSRWEPWMHEEAPSATSRFVFCGKCEKIVGPGCPFFTKCERVHQVALKKRRAKRRAKLDPKPVNPELVDSREPTTETFACQDIYFCSAACQHAHNKSVETQPTGPLAIKVFQRQRAKMENTLLGTVTNSPDIARIILAYSWSARVFLSLRNTYRKLGYTYGPLCFWSSSLHTQICLALYDSQNCRVSSFLRGMLSDSRHASICWVLPGYQLATRTCLRLTPLHSSLMSSKTCLRLTL